MPILIALVQIIASAAPALAGGQNPTFNRYLGNGAGELLKAQASPFAEVTMTRKDPPAVAGTVRG